MKILILLFTFNLFFLNSCAFLKDSSEKKNRISNFSKKHLYLEKFWITSTLESHYLGGRFHHKSSPLILENLVIQGNSINGITAFNKKTGAQKWKLPIQNGIESNLYKDKDSLFFGGNDGFFYSINTKDGNIQWKEYLKSEGFGPALVHQDTVYFISGGDILYALKKKSGKRIWLYKNSESSASLSPFSIRGSTQPLVVGNLLYVGFKTGHFVALDRTNGRLIWSKRLSSQNKKKEFEDIDSNPIFQGNCIYVSSYSGSLYCLNAKTGEKIWTVKEGSASSVELSLGELLYYSTSSGKVLAITKDSGKIIWTYKIENGIATQPVFFKGLLFFGESSGLLKVLDANSGKKIQEFESGTGLTAKPTIDLSNEMLYFISNDANLFALKIRWKTKKRFHLEKVF